MAFLKKVFSGPYRRGVQLEAEGRFREAAQQFALAEEHDRVVAMNLRAAQASTSPNERIEFLTAALSHAQSHPEAQDRIPEAARALAEQMAVVARDGGLVTELDRRTLGEAAAMWAKAGDFEAAGDAARELGRLEDSANYYKQAGSISKMESVYALEREAREQAATLKEGWSAYQEGLRSGDRARARLGIESCCQASPENPDYRAARDDLLARWPNEGQLHGRLGAQRVSIIGTFPARLGRDEECAIALRDNGVSRVHAVFDASEDGFTLEDAASKNGTRLDGLPATEVRQLAAEGIVSIGLSLDFAYAVRRSNGGAPVLNLEVIRGLDKGAIFILSMGAVLPRRGGGAADLPAIPAGFFVQDAQVWLRPAPSAEAVLELNGEKIIGAILPIRGDRIRLGDLLLEVD